MKSMSVSLKRSFSLSTILFLMSPVQAAPPSIERGFADLAKKVSGAVVNISTYASPKQQGRPGMMYGDDPFRRFFEEFYGGRMAPSERSEKPAKPVQVALGTGFIIDANEGLILTNHHVIQGAEEVKIQFKEEDSELIPAEVIGRDPELDIALLKVKTKMKMTSVPLGDSDKIDVGEYVIAIGNPLGYGHTVTHGILSAKGRRNPEFRLGRYLQTDASINPGNSGGPLINMEGEVIGINNAIDARGQAIGFAIPINSVKTILTQLRTKGSVTRGYLGVSAADLTDEVATQLNLKAPLKGIVVADIGRGTPADKAGLKPYDVITAVNGEKVTNASDLTAKIVMVPVGAEIDIAYVRNGKERTTKAKVTARPVAGQVTEAPQVPRDPSPLRGARFEEHGFEVMDLSPQFAREFGIPFNESKGKQVIVSDLAYGRPAAQSGLARGDIILDVAGKSVSSVTEMVKTISNLGQKAKKLMLRIKRFDPQGNSTVSVVVIDTE